MGKKTDVSKIIGERFGRLTIIGDEGVSKRRVTQVKVKCDCGNEKILLLQTLRSGLVKSCGCYNKEVARKRATKHGLKGHQLYPVWKSMKTRCYNKNSKNYKYYGGKGVVVCDEWKHDFLAFYSFSMANGWQPGLEVDRVNNDESYKPENCRFVTHKVNSNNRGPRHGKPALCVNWSKKDSRWVTWITIDKKQHGLGSSKDFIEAVSLRLAAEQCTESVSENESLAHVEMQKYLGERNTFLKLKLGAKVVG